MCVCVCPGQLKKKLEGKEEERRGERCGCGGEGWGDWGIWIETEMLTLGTR